MNITKQDFESMKDKYDKEVKKGKPAKGKDDKDKTNQTSWIFLDRGTLEEMLANVDKDPKVGGIQFYFTEYTEDTAKQRYGAEGDQYIGQMTLVTRPANLVNNQLQSPAPGDTSGGYQNTGTQCPYICEPSPTDT